MNIHKTLTLNIQIKKFSLSKHKIFNNFIDNKLLIFF